MKIGVYGSAADSLEGQVNLLAKQIGREIALTRNVVVTGGCTGYPYEAVLGAAELNGECIAFSPAADLESHVSDFKFPVKGFSQINYVPLSLAPYGMQQRLKFRNVLSTIDVDAGIIVGGQTGTMNEFTLLFDQGKNIGILEGTGGVTEAIKDFMKHITKDRGSEIVYDSDPASLVRKLVELG